jgi:hypothetical protein
VSVCTSALGCSNGNAVGDSSTRQMGLSAVAERSQVSLPSDLRSLTCALGSVERSRGVDVASSLERLADMAPTGYSNWASIARDGASAARLDELDAVKSACRSCHLQYEDRYRRDIAMGRR